MGVQVESTEKKWLRAWRPFGSTEWLWGHGLWVHKVRRGKTVTHSPGGPRFGSMETRQVSTVPWKQTRRTGGARFVMPPGGIVVTVATLLSLASSASLTHPQQRPQKGTKSDHQLGISNGLGLSLPCGWITFGGIEGSREGEHFGTGGERRVSRPLPRLCTQEHPPFPQGRAPGQPFTHLGARAEGQKRPGMGCLGSGSLSGPRGAGVASWLWVLKGSRWAGREEGETPIMRWEEGPPEGPPRTNGSGSGARPAGSEDITGLVGR